ncbi:hypothetical protein LCGC14_1435540 [marine sediment metagenome]|uniref:Uncharacterized protein n=1 Tax=marine sediment metagenome TaxID=412755 RepID=A0A0F9M2U8_9ZZZZ
MTTEHRVVCDRFGTRGHGNRHANHVWPKRDKKKAVQAVIDANHHAETVVGPDHFYRQEAPYRRQEREVTAWEDSDE